MSALYSAGMHTLTSFSRPEIQFAIIQPLEAQLAENNDPSIVYVLLLVRLQYLRERDSFLASSSLNETRATLCELLAIKLLRHQATTVKGPNAGLLAMSRALVGGLHAFQGAEKDVLQRVKQGEGYASRTVDQGAGKTNALELAILGKARLFIKSQATQRVINAIWDGRVVYTSSSFINVLPGTHTWRADNVSLLTMRHRSLEDSADQRVQCQSCSIVGPLPSVSRRVTRLVCTADVPDQRRRVRKYELRTMKR